jgi:hypothetical protein
MSGVATACHPAMDDVYVGARKRLDDQPRLGERGVVEVTYFDEHGNEGDGCFRSVEMCPEGAIALAKELRRWAGIVNNTGTAKRAS